MGVSLVQLGQAMCPGTACNDPLPQRWRDNRGFDREEPNQALARGGLFNGMHGLVCKPARRGFCRHGVRLRPGRRQLDLFDLRAGRFATRLPEAGFRLVFWTCHVRLLQYQVWVPQPYAG